MAFLRVVAANMAIVCCSHRTSFQKGTDRLIQTRWLLLLQIATIGARSSKSEIKASFSIRRNTLPLTEAYAGHKVVRHGHYRLLQKRGRSRLLLKVAQRWGGRDLLCQEL